MADEGQRAFADLRSGRARVPGMSREVAHRCTHFLVTPKIDSTAIFSLESLVREQYIKILREYIV